MKACFRSHLRGVALLATFFTLSACNKASLPGTSGSASSSGGQGSTGSAPATTETSGASNDGTSDTGKSTTTLIPASPQPIPAAASALAKPVIKPSNLIYKGAFTVPMALPSGKTTAFSYGTLAYRWVTNGQGTKELHFFTTGSVTDGGPVYEVAYPGSAVSSDPAQLPEATITADWGNLYNDAGGKDLRVDPAGNGIATYGLWFDPKGNKLFWNYGDTYECTSPQMPSTGYSVLDDSKGSATAMAAYNFKNSSEKQTRGGMTPIPQWFADTYLGGANLAVGFGGYFSCVSTGGSIGPHLTAINEPDASTSPDGSTLTDQVVMSFPYEVGARFVRDPNYSSAFDTNGTGTVDPPGPLPTTDAAGWTAAAAAGAYNPLTVPTDPSQPWAAFAWLGNNNYFVDLGLSFIANPNVGSQVGYLAWTDTFYQGATFIDTPHFQGVLYLGAYGIGNVWYDMSYLHANGYEFEWSVLDTATLAEVMQGTRQSWQAQPKYVWVDPKFPMVPAFQGGPGVDMTGGYGATGPAVLYLPGVSLDSSGGIVEDPTSDGLLLVNTPYGRYDATSNASYPVISIFQLACTGDPGSC